MSFLGTPRWPPLAKTGKTIRAVCRVSKVSGFGSVAAMEAHHLRTRPTRNADPAQLDRNVWLLRHEGGLVDAVRTRIERAEQLRKEAAEAAGKKSPRKRREDAVLAVEVVLSASPEFFRPDNPEAAGTWDQERLDAWTEASMAWLRAKHGDNLVSAVVHLDEVTPHIQAVFVPLTADNRLSAKDLLSDLSALQTSYGDAVAPLGIQRGMEGSTASHTDVKTFYSAVNKALAPDLPAISVSAPPLATVAMGGGKQWAKAQGERLEAEVGQVVHEAEARSKMAELEREGVRRTHGVIASLSARTGEAAAKAAASRAAQEVAEARQKAAETREQAWKAQADRARSLPLWPVLEAAGWDRDPKDADQWVGSGSRISVKGEQFYDHQRGKGGGGAIDLAMHLTGCGFRDTMAWLSSELGENSQAHVSKDLMAEAKRVEEKPPAPFELPEQDEAMWPAARHYLVEQRRLPGWMVDQLRTARKIIPVGKNVLFAMTTLAREIVGAELRGVVGVRWRGTHGRSSRNRGAFRIARGPRSGPVDVYVVESAIDAMSLYELTPPHPERREVFVSTAGARGFAPWLSELLGTERHRLFVAYDGDEAGERAAVEMMSEYPKAQRWKARKEDWNADLVERESRKATDPHSSESSPEPVDEEPDDRPTHFFPR